MKKRILSILLTLCMVLMLVPATAFADEGYYTITQNFKYGAHQRHGVKVETSPYTYEQPAIATVSLGTVIDCAPYKFVGWKETSSGMVYEPNASILPESNLTFEAVYEVDGSLAITVEGFEVGKTPNDCTYTFDSTIPDITFSEDDICGGVEWEKYVVDGTGYSWANVGKTEVFQADTPYRLLLALNSDLELPPAVTVNGITPTTCRIAITNNQPFAIVIFCEFGTPPEPALTISGPDVVCAEQDYEFSVTPAKGVLAQPEFEYSYDGFLTYDSGLLNILDGVIPAEKYDLDQGSFELRVRGELADETVVKATKTVQVSPEHIYVDGVCGCGAVQQYTITYDGGEGVEGSIPAGVKTHGEDFTLSSETFTWDGFVQTGWIDKEGAIYDLGGVYTLDEDMTFSPYWEKIITLTVPYTTTVALGDVGVPGEKTFTLALIGDSAPDKDKSNVTVSGSVTTNGKGSYNGTLTITGPEETLWYMLSEGAFVQQVDGGEDGWTYDDTVWGLLLTQAADDSTADAAEFAVLVVPALCEETDDGVRYDIDWDAIDWEAPQSEDMRFTNIYTKSTTQPAEPTQPEESNPNAGTTTSPQTGDNSNLFLWIALLFAGGFGVIGTGVYSKRRRSTK